MKNIVSLISFYFAFFSLVNAQTFSNNVGGSIPDNGKKSTSYPITVSGVGNLSTTNGLTSVCVNITHSYVSDLSFYLQSPDGRVVILSVGNGGSGDNYNTTCFSMSATRSISSGSAPFNGSYLPEGNLGYFNNGTSGDGVWNLWIRDVTSGIVGSLKSVSLTFGSDAPAAPEDCGNSPVASDACIDAVPICDLNGYCGTTADSYDNAYWPELFNSLNACSRLNIDNNSFLTFVASNSDVSLQVEVTNCVNNDGIQFFVFSSAGVCSGSVTTHYCNTDMNPGLNTIDITGLTSGKTYYLMVDGQFGDVCDYRVKANSGIQTLEIVSSAGSIICPETTTKLSVIGGGVGPFTYSWSPNPISGQNTAEATYKVDQSTVVSVIVGGSCGSSATVKYPITVEVPNFSLPSNPSLCAGSSTNLIASGNPNPETISFSNSNDFVIPDNNATGISSNITVTGLSGNVGNQIANVTLNINHKFTGDLDISLRCPNGTIIDLSTDNGFSGDNYTNTVFSPSATTSITSGVAPFSGSYLPEGNFSALSGCNLNGIWTLIVKDDANLTTGSLLDWSISFSNSYSYTWSPSSGLNSTTGSTVTASPSTTTKYKVTATSFVGCSKSDSVLVTVNPSPEIGNKSDTICSQNTFSITPVNQLNDVVPTGTTYSWSVPVVTGGITGGTSGNNATTITGNLVNPTNVPQTATYIVTPTSGLGCKGSTFTLTVVVNPKPSINNLTAFTCSGVEFSSSPINVTNGVVPNGTTYSWTLPTVTGGLIGGLAGSGDTIKGVLTNPTNVAQEATYIVTPTSGKCIGSPFTIKVSINSRPSVNNIQTSACSNATFASNPTNGINGLIPPGTSFVWTTPEVVSGMTGGTSGSGSSITGKLVNNTDTAQVAVYTVTPKLGSCSGEIFKLSVVVNPSPEITAINDNFCSNASFSVIPVNGVILAGTTYSWGIPIVTGSMTGGAFGSNSSDINGKLINPSNRTQTATYSVTPKSGLGCDGRPFTLTINIKPKPSISDLTASACSNNMFKVSPTNGTNGIIPNGTKYSWSSPSVTGQMTGGTAGSGDTIKGVLTNSTILSQVATYSVTPSFEECSGNPFEIKVTINPLPKVNDLTVSSCSGSSFNLTPINGTNGTVPSGTTYSWPTPTVNSNVTGGSSGTNVTTISGKLTSSSNNAENATYTITPKSIAGCLGLPFELKVTIDPLPEKPLITITPPTCNSSGKATISNFVSSQTYTFSPSGPTLGTGGLVNGMTLLVNYTVKTSKGNCTSEFSSPFNISAQVNTLAMPIIDTVAGNCLSIGLASITNYKSNLNYLFTPSGPSINSTGKILNLKPGIQYSVQASDNICFSNATPYFSIDPIKPLVFPIYYIDTTSGCTPLPFSLTASFQPGLLYQWYANGQFIGKGSIISGIFNSEDCYDITLTISNSLGCSLTSTTNDMICAKQSPAADFSVNTTTLISSYQEISFDNNSQNASSYVWDFGNGDTSILINPTYYYQDISDDINVRLYAYSANKCFDSTSILLRFIEDASFYIPNTFTPDKDEFNENWGPVFTQGYEPYYFEIQVVNRWGEIIWESYDSKSRWNGTYGSTTRECPDGVYIWKIICRPKETTMKIQLTGSIRLIR